MHYLSYLNSLHLQDSTYFLSEWDKFSEYFYKFWHCFYKEV